MLYLVQWCNHEGNLQQKGFDRLEDAQLDAAYLKTRYDYVVIVADDKIQPA